MMAVDLLNWPDLRDAEQAHAAATAAWEEAKRRWRLAPWGYRLEREAVMHERAREALAAEVALEKARREAGES